MINKRTILFMNHQDGSWNTFQPLLKDYAVSTDTWNPLKNQLKIM